MNRRIRKRHIKYNNIVKITNNNPITTLHLNKSLKHFPNNIIFDVGFFNLDKIHPEKIKYSVIYLSEEGIEIRNDMSINDIHTNIYKFDYWKLNFKKTIDSLVVYKLLITVEPFIECEFVIINNYELNLK